jgi:hypothetical protein
MNAAKMFKLDSAKYYVSSNCQDGFAARPDVRRFLGGICLDRKHSLLTLQFSQNTDNRQSNDYVFFRNSFPGI